MSHSTVLVVVREADGPEEAEAKAEALLAPFSENDPVEPYRSYDEGEKPSDHWCHKLMLKEGQITEGVDWPTYAAAYNARYSDSDPLLVDEEGRAYSMSTYNPRSKWDWYSLGGRWTGHWPLRAAVGAVSLTGRPGVMTKRAKAGTADIARKRDIDWDSLRMDAELEAEATWARVQAALTATHVTPEDYTSYRSWEDTRTSATNIDAARETYWGQPLAKAMKALDAWDASPEDYCLLEADPHAAYLRQEVARAGSTFAVLDGEEWRERGRMGWFGIVADEKPMEDWLGWFASFLESLPDETWLAVYDVHI